MAVSDVHVRKQLDERPGEHTSDETARLQLEVAELKRQLEVSQSRLRTAEKEVSNQSEIIALMADTAKVHDSVICDLESRIDRDEKEMVHNEEKIKSLSAALADQKTRNTSLQETVASSRQQLQQLQAKDVDCFLRDCVIKNLHLDVNEMTLQYKDCYSEVVRQHGTLSVLRDENLELRVHMYHLQQEVDRLEARLSVLSKEEARGRHEATSESRKQCEALVKELEAREQQNKILENNEKANELKLLNLQAQIDGLSKEKETLQEHLNTSASLVSELDSSVVEWSQCAGELREEVCLLRESNDKQEVLVRDCERDKQNYAEQLDDCSSQVLRLAAELQSIMRERDELKKQLRTLEKHARTAARLEAESHCLQSELTLATKTAEDQERTIHLLTAEKAADAGKWVNTTSEIARLESEVKSLHQTVKEQDNELEKASFAFIKAVQLEREVCTVGRELDAAKTTLAEQESELARSEEEIKSFKSQIAAQNRELEAYESLGFEYQQLIMHADSQALQEMCRQLQTWARQNATLHMEVHTLRNNYNMLALDLRLKQKALQDLANVSLATERSHSGQVQELTHANLQQQVLVKQLGSQTEQLQKEMNALQTARVAVIEKNALLENCNTSLLSELHRLKRRVQEHEHQIQVSEAHAADVAEQLRECRTLLDEVWEDVQTCSSVASDRQTGMEALRCATVRLEKTAAQSMSLQKGPLTTNTTTVGCFSPEDKRADQQRQPEAASSTQEQVAALRKEKEWLLSEVAMLKRLQDEAVAEVAALKEQLLGANRELRAMQCKMFHLSKERDQRDEEVKNVEALLQV